jgi:hypothetical protein
VRLWRDTHGRYSHIDPATGRNKRETAKLVKRSERSAGAGNQIKMASGRPIERRIDQKRRNKTARKKGW